jgi:hypothetical protein
LVAADGKAPLCQNRPKAGVRINLNGQRKADVAGVVHYKDADFRQIDAAGKTADGQELRVVGKDRIG